MNLSTMTKRDLETLLEKQKTLLADTSIVDKLPDKGEKIKQKVQQILIELENKSKQESEIQSIVAESTQQQYISSGTESQTPTTLWDAETEMEIKLSLKTHITEKMDNDNNTKPTDDDVDWLEKKLRMLEVKDKPDPKETEKKMLLVHGRKGIAALPQKKHAGLKPLSLKDSLVLIKQEHADYLLEEEAEEIKNLQKNSTNEDDEDDIDDSVNFEEVD